MMTEIFNTEFEVSIRLLVLLDTIGLKVTATRAAFLDFVSTYGKNFGVTSENLHGDNGYSFSEYAARKRIVDSALKSLVLKEYARPLYSRSGFAYKITKAGKLFCEQLNDEYADSYRENVQRAQKYFIKYSDRELMKYINKYAVEKLKGD